MKKLIKLSLFLCLTVVNSLLYATVIVENHCQNGVINIYTDASMQNRIATIGLGQNYALPTLPVYAGYSLASLKAPISQPVEIYRPDHFDVETFCHSNPTSGHPIIFGNGMSLKSPGAQEIHNHLGAMVCELYADDFEVSFETTGTDNSNGFITATLSLDGGSAWNRQSVTLAPLMNGSVAT